ncbi:hypothetical protein [Ensifer sp. 4252]|uniref:hypothetical protein n=1 Tax=Ensifer sp. 4252 TaxID=3373915 RepID=UPI003D1DCB23
MRSILLGLALALFGMSPALSACNDDLLIISKWSIKPIDSHMNELSFTVRSSAGKGIRMLDAQLRFTDTLGATIGPLVIDRDVTIPALGSFTDTRVWGPFTIERLLKVNAEDITAHTCVHAVVYDDGSKESFE